MATFSMRKHSGNTPARKPSRRAVVFLILFALPFAGGGTFVGYLAGSMVTTWVRARAWDEVPARILSADLDMNRGDDSTTYRVRATYQYDYGGTSYVSDRVAGGFGSDNIGSFHQEKYAELRPYSETGRPFRCFVNPADPSEALLYRELRWGMLGFQTTFALVFCLVGYGLMFAAVYGGRLAKEADILRERHAAEPWLWEKDWVDGRIQAGSRGRMIGAILFATLWNLISAPIIFIAPRELAAGNHLVLIGLLFPLVGAALAAYAVYAVLQWRKFGNTEFELFSNPGVLGGYLEGRVHTNIRSRKGEGFRVTLSCIRKETRGSGDNRRTTEKTLWQDSVHVAANELSSGPHGASVPVRFAIPYSAGPQSDPEGSDPVIWRVDVNAELPGVDFAARFKVPVFETPDSDPQLEVELDGPPLSASTEAAEELESIGILRRPTPQGGVSYVFRRARAKSAAIALTVFTTIWCGCIWLMISLGAPIFFPIVFGLSALLMLAGVVDLWLKQTRVQVDGGRLALNRRLLGSGKTLIFSAGDIAALRLSRGMQSGNKLYYRIQLRTRAGKTHTLASQITDQRLAKRLIEDLETAMAA
jgi:hypothetical protein